MSGTLISVSYFFLRSFCWNAVAQFDCKQLPYQSPLWFFISALYCLIGCYLLVYYVECAVNYKYAYQVYVIILGRNIDFIQVFVSSTFFRVERGSKDHFLMLEESFEIIRKVVFIVPLWNVASSVCKKYIRRRNCFFHLKRTCLACLNDFLLVEWKNP